MDKDIFGMSYLTSNQTYSWPYSWADPESDAEIRAAMRPQNWAQGVCAMEAERQRQLYMNQNAAWFMEHVRLAATPISKITLAQDYAAAVRARKTAMQVKRLP